MVNLFLNNNIPKLPVYGDIQLNILLENFLELLSHEKFANHPYLQGAEC
jgi:hypothetical protein